MKFINKFRALHRKIYAGFLSVFLLISITGCSNVDYSAKYGEAEYVQTNGNMNFAGTKSKTFASDLCIIDENDLLGDGSLDLTQCESAVIFDINNSEVLYSKNAHETLYPASITKIMTALVAIKYGNMDDVLVATNAVNINESGAQLAGIVSGDSMTLYQAIRLLLIYSANDAGLLIAENIGNGSVEDFVELMNEEAQKLGATNTHFMNPHGLHDAYHYTTAYDIYLIFNECIKYDEFTEIISMQSYETSYTNGSGNTKNVNIKNTNGYISGSYTAPTNITVLGGKTGTTSAAGHCLVILSKDINGSPYISVVLKSETTDSLYNNMNSLLQVAE